jgi:hypothetical protein
VLTRQELDCGRDHLPFGAGVIDMYSVETKMDSTDTYYLPTKEFSEKRMSFKVRQGMTAIRVILGYANSKVSLVKDGHEGVLIESKGQDSGRS